MFGSIGNKDDIEVPAPSRKKEKMVKAKRVLQPLPEEKAVAVEYFEEEFSFDDSDEEVEGEQEVRRRRIPINFERLPVVKMDVAKSHQKVYSDKASTPLTLQKQVLHMDVVASTVQTSTTMTFFNEYDKVLEGNLIFPLPRDTAIHGYGLDIDGVMVDAVPVPKEKARIAFETTVRQKGPAISVAEVVDPYANSFKTNVYPMNPSGRRTIKVVTLNQMIDDKVHNLFFAHVQKPASMKEFQFSYRCKVPGTQVMVRRSSGAMEPVSDLSTIYATSDFEGILLIVPKQKGFGASVVLEKDPDSGYHYFCATYSNLTDTAEKKKKEITLKNASVFFDVSSSRRFSEWKQEVKFLKSFMEANPNCQVEFTTFSNAIVDKKTFKKFDNLLEYVTNIDFDGGTCLPLKEMSSTNKSDVIILMSDGISTIGPDLESQLFAMKFGAPIYCCSSSPSSAYVMLRYLGDRSGGFSFDVTECDIQEIVQKIGIEQFGVKNVLYDSLRSSEVLVSPMINKSVSVYGRLIENEGYVQIDLGNNQILQADINLKTTPILEEGSTTIRTLWAQRKIQQLSIFSTKNQKEIEQIGMEYGIITSETSLIVLSELSQYQQYKIVPPRQLKQMRKQYLNTIMTVEKNEEERRKNKVRNVLNKWNRRISWHKRDFKPVKQEVKRMKKKKCCSASLGCCRRSCNCCRNRCCRSVSSTDEDLGCSLQGAAPSDDDDDEDEDCECEEEEEEEEKCEKPSTKKKKKNKKKEKEKSSSKASIKIKAYIPGSAYMDAIRNQKGKEAQYKEYLKQKKESFEESPSFYLDCADYFMTILNDMKLGIKVLSNCSELELNNIQLMRIIGYRLDQAEEYESSIQVFSQVLKLKPEEPQSYRDLALVYERIGNFEKAARLLYTVIGGKWDSRFDEIELTAAVELNHVLENIKDVKERQALIEEIGIEKELIYHMDCDIRISMAWDTDMTDIDLHVYDPNGEHCYYGHKETRSGGFISRDFTRGYGPEEFMQKKVWKNGKFRITAKYFASHQQSLTGGTTILTTFFTHYLQPNEQRQLVTLRLTTNKEDIEICEIDFKM